MIAALKSEYRKLFSTRMWWVLLLCAAGYLALMGAGIGALVGGFMGEADGAGPGADADGETGALGPGGLNVALMVYSMAGSLAYVFPLLLGALSITQEYRHKTITQTFLGEPRRLVVLAAKLIASVALGLVSGLVCVAATAGPGGLAMSLVGADPGFSDSDTWIFFARALLDFTLWAVVGVALGTLLTNQVAMIVVVLAVTQFVEPLLRTLPDILQEEWSWPKYLPGAAGDAVQGDTFYAVMSGGDSGLLPFGWAVVVLLAWALGLAAIGYLVKFRRDVS
ncbi:MAG: hypothetical protein LBG11_03665 [Bifidobacteriaceae bacterium]|jgi:hypothetical protein|nr:hypothetical protein [Bifidobacteriaceae bacterium]